MILSSGDIISRLAGDPVVRSLAKFKLIDNRPPLEVGSGIIIYVSKYPISNELTATWNIWIIDFDNEPLDILVIQIKKLLPDFKILEQGVVIKASTTDLLSSKTEVKPNNNDNKQPKTIDQSFNLELKFQELKQSIEDRMLVTRSGSPGRDGLPGKDGAPGVDGRDMLATDASLDDLKDVSTADAKKGQFLMFDGTSWIARFVPKILSMGHSNPSAGVSVGGGIEEAPLDGMFYLRSNGQWIEFTSALTAINSARDGGEFSL